MTYPTVDSVTARQVRSTTGTSRAIKAAELNTATLAGPTRCHGNSTTPSAFISLPRSQLFHPATRFGPTRTNAGTLGEFEMTSDLRSLDRRVRFWSMVALGSFVGLRVAVDTYSGPSIALGLSITFGVAVAFGLTSLWFGERFWRFVRRFFYFFFWSI